jgi:tetratricopeptide (TPR) repeat protein
MFSWFKKKAAPPTPPAVPALSSEVGATPEPPPLPERVSEMSTAPSPTPTSAPGDAAQAEEASPSEAPFDAPSGAVGEGEEALPPERPSFEALKRQHDESPQDGELALRTARAGIAEGRNAQALPIFHRAARLLVERDPEAGIAAYAELRKLSELGAETHFLLADIHREAGRLKEAEAEVRVVLRGDMNSTEALLRLCDLCIATERYRDAELSCNRLLSIDPRDPFAREKLGDVYVASQRPEEAVKAYVLAAHNFVALQEKAEALRLYERALELDPQHPTAIREIPALKAALG